MRRITATLSVKSIQDAQRQLRAYKKELTKKCERFVSALADKGIVVARESMGSSGYAKYILFEKEIDPVQYGARAILAASNTGLIRSQWRTLNTAGGIATADISPILMAEFGAGVRHDKNPKAHKMGMGAGTFPGQMHAFDEDGWWYLDMDWEWHHVDGVEPTMPMYHAAEEMERQLLTTAKEVFGL